MRRSPHGYGQAHFQRLLAHFGFKESKGKKHTAYRHELLDPGAVILVPRHNDIRAHVARKAVTSIDLVIARQQEAEHGEDI